MIAGVNPMMMAGMMNGGSTSEMMKMMALMSFMKTPSNSGSSSSSSGTAAGGSASDVAANPLFSGMIKMGLCKRTDTNDTPFCTVSTCMMQGMLYYGNPNMYQCVPGFGCCYKDHNSMMFSKLVN